MQNNQEKILVKSVFDSAACHKQALIFYIVFSFLDGQWDGHILG